MKRFKSIIGFSILGVYIVVMMSFVNGAYNHSTCKTIDIVIEDSLSTRFVRKDDIQKTLNDFHYDLLGQRCNTINLYEIETRIQQHPSIEDCDCYWLANSDLQISIKQRCPIARVLTNRYNFYIDESGREMPLSDFYTAHVPVITGNIKPEIISTDLFKIINVLKSDEFWSAQIIQIVVEPNGEYTLIPRAGRQRIEIGTVENLEMKFQSLKALYIQVFNNNAWNKYKTISLKYDGQVVCTKK